jgi:hypothetical protein
MKLSIGFIGFILFCIISTSIASYKMATENSPVYAKHFAVAQGGRYDGCQPIDTDGDGYVTCSISKDGEAKTLQCPIGWWGATQCYVGQPRRNYISN